LQQLQALRTGSETSEDKTGKDLHIQIKIAPEDFGDGKRP
jgi:hypothetical protein